MRQLAGRKLGGRYLLTQQVGVGTTSTVWEATDEVLQRTVAVKVINEALSADAAFIEQFRRQAMAAARLSGPGIVAIYDTVSEPDVDAVVMELLVGMTLGDFLRKYAPLEPHDAVDLGQQVLVALESAHDAGVVHAQIRPETIILCDDRRVKLTDTGFLVSAPRDAGSCAAPEVTAGGRPDPRSDVFSVGVVLYECLTATLPYRSRPAAGEGPPPMSAAGVTVTPDLEAAVSRALSVAPETRFQSAAEFARALSRIDLRRLPPPLPDAPPGHSDGDSGHKAPALLAAAAAALVVLAGLALIATGPGRDAIRSVAEGLGLVAPDDNPDSATSAPPQTEAPPAAAPTTTTTTSVSGENASIVAAAAFDPPPGSGSEHDELVPLSIDGDPSTIWHSESYASREFGGLKDGIGLIVELAGITPVGIVDVVSASHGWSLEVYAADVPASDLAGWGDPVAGANAVSGSAQFDLGGRAAGTLLIWVTDLGNAPPPLRVEIAEVSIRDGAAG